MAQVLDLNRSAVPLFCGVNISNWPLAKYYTNTELAFKTRVDRYNKYGPTFTKLFFLDERQNKVCMYREELCVHKKLHEWSIAAWEGIYEAFF